MDPATIFKDGEPWRDLTRDVESAAAATVITRDGTARLVDLENRRHLRVPLEGGHRLAFDGTWLPIGWFLLGPCGLVIEHAFRSRSTPARLVLEGLVPE